MSDLPSPPDGIQPAAAGDERSAPEAEFQRLRAENARLAGLLEQAAAERQALARELAEAQTQAEQTQERLATAHARELERRDAQHDARLARVAEAQREALDAIRAAHTDPHRGRGQRAN